MSQSSDMFSLQFGIRQSLDFYLGTAKVDQQPNLVSRCLQIRQSLNLIYIFQYRLRLNLYKALLNYKINALLAKDQVFITDLYLNFPDGVQSRRY